MINDVERVGNILLPDRKVLLAIENESSNNERVIDVQCNAVADICDLNTDVKVPIQVVKSVESQQQFLCWNSYLNTTAVWYNIRIIFVPIFLTIALAFSFGNLFSGTLRINRNDVNLGYMMNAIVGSEWWTVVDPIDVWAGFISWSWTNLYIRRRLNPEIGEKAFEL